MNGVAIATTARFICTVSNGKHRKVPKISHAAYIFQRSFQRVIFLEDLIFGGAYVYVQREIYVSKLIGLSL